MTVDLITHMGSDLTVVNAARVSFDKESNWEGIPFAGEIEGMLSEKDEKLIKYLARHKHWTPFGHCFAQFRITAPVFVARQLIKHQVGLVWMYGEVKLKIKSRDLNLTVWHHKT